MTRHGIRRTRRRHAAKAANDGWLLRRAVDGRDGADAATTLTLAAAVAK
jgi:hypothetical protein